MPRPLRPIEDGSVYHVINRGNNRQPVFFKNADYAAFLATIVDLKERKPFQLNGYCLLNNHFHRVSERKKGSELFSTCENSPDPFFDAKTRSDRLEQEKTERTETRIACLVTA